MAANQSLLQAIVGRQGTSKSIHPLLKAPLLAMAVLHLCMGSTAQTSLLQLPSRCKRVLPVMVIMRALLFWVTA